MILCDATDDVDTRAITRRLRQDGSLIGVLSTDNSITDEELLKMSRSWDIVGKNMNLWDSKKILDVEACDRCFIFQVLI